MHSCPFRTHQW